MKYFPLKKNRTFFYDVQGTHGAGKVLLRAAPPGTGIIAGGPIRSVFEVLGIHDVVAKSLGTTNPHNMVRATMNLDSNGAEGAEDHVDFLANGFKIRRDGNDINKKLL